MRNSKEERRVEGARRRRIRAALLVLSVSVSVLPLTIRSEESAPKNGEGATSLAAGARLYDTVAPGVVGIAVRNLPRSRPGSGVTHFGTGTMIDPYGLVLTSITVVPKGSRFVEVFLPGGRLASARIVKMVSDKEIALIRILDYEKVVPKGSKRLPYLKLASSKSVRVGDAAYSLGNAFHSIEEDDQIVVCSGIISARLKLEKKHVESPYVGPVLETTAALNGGMDGGPLVDAQGRLIGLLILNFSKHRWLGTAIPSDVLKPVLNAERAWFDDRSGAYKASAGFEAVQIHRDRHVRVLNVQPKSPAASAGLRKGDVIREFDGKPLEKLARMHEWFRKADAGNRARLVVERDGNTEKIEIELWGNF